MIFALRVSGKQTGWNYEHFVFNFCLWGKTLNCGGKAIKRKLKKKKKCIGYKHKTLIKLLNGVGEVLFVGNQ